MFLNEKGEHAELVFDEVKISNTNIEETNKNIYHKTLEKGAEHMIALGGDHSITYSTFRAFAEKHQNPGIIVFDAHPDLENSFKPPTHEDYLRVLIEDKIVKPENVITVGTRAMHKNESEFIKNHNLKVFSMNEISVNGREEVCDNIMQQAREFGALYLSIDIDVLDPAFAPAWCAPPAVPLVERDAVEAPGPARPPQTGASLGQHERVELGP